MSSSTTNQANAKGLLFLGASCGILKEQLQGRILEGKREACEIVFADFDDTSYKISCSHDSPNIVRVSIALRDAVLLKSMGAKDIIDRLYPGMDSATPDVGYAVTLQFDCDRLPGDPNTFLNDVSELKKNILSGPLDRTFTSLNNKKSSSDDKIITIKYRANEQMFVCPLPSKVVVIFLVDFNDPTDKAMARIFLQEFVEAQRTVRTAPPVSFSKDAPLELSSLNLSYSPDIAGFISFALEDRHVSGTKATQAIALLTGFRNYLHYHIKCSKTYLHMRMRKRVAGWMQVLNRAFPDQEIEKKTAQGKTFNRK